LAYVLSNLLRLPRDQLEVTVAVAWFPVTLMLLNSLERVPPAPSRVAKMSRGSCAALPLHINDCSPAKSGLLRSVSQVAANCLIWSTSGPVESAAASELLSEPALSERVDRNS